MRVLGKVLTVSALGLLVAAAMPACAANDQSIYIRLVQAPPTTRGPGGCTHQADPTQAALAEGTLDVAATDAYFAWLLIGSQLRERGDTASTRAESNRTHLNGAVVTVTETSGALISEFTATGTGFVDPQSSNTGAFGLLGVNLIDAPTAAKLANDLGPDLTSEIDKLIIVNVKAFGKTLGGVDLETGEFQFPIRVCKGCLITYASGNDPATPGLDCSVPLGATTAGATQVTIPCNAGQDEITPCQLCQTHKACRGDNP